MNTDSKTTANEIAKVLLSKKAEDILIIDIKDKTIIADFFIVCTGRNTILTKTLSDEVEEKMKLNHGTIAQRVEGYSEGRWIVMDYGDVLVHIFHPDERQYYNIERLWEDGTNTAVYTGEQA